MEQLLRLSFVLLVLMSNVFPSFAYQAGDTVVVGAKKYILKGANLIFNPGFESGFTGWTDATSSAATLTSANFRIETSGGVDNSKYLVGTKNESASSAGSIGTGWKIESGKTYLFSYNVKYTSSTAAAASEEYLKISLTNTKTASAEPKVLIAATQVNGGGQWTFNSVVFTNSDPAYSYVVARFRWLNNRLGFDNFSLNEAYEMPDIAGLRVVISQAQSVYTVSGNGAATLQAAIVKAQSYLSSESASDVDKAKTDLSQAVFSYQLLNASSTHPLEMTSRITNPGFDQNTGTGWTGAGTVNYHEVEFYQSIFNMYQIVTGLPAGKYSLRVRGFERPKSNDGGAAYRAGTEKIYARFYAKSSNFPERTVPLNSVYKHTYSGSDALNGYVNNMSGAETMFNNTANAYYVTTIPDIVLSEGATLTIGARSDFQQGGYWALFDDFRLFYEGAGESAAATQVNELVTTAQALAASKMQTAVATELNAAVTQGQLVAGANPLVLADLSAASLRLSSAISVAEISISAYTALQDMITSATGVYGNGSGKESKALQEAIAAARVAVNNLNATLEATNQATSTLKTAVFAYQLANATGAVPTVTTNTQYARGSSVAFLRGTFSGISVSERGICWSTDPDPTVLDNRSTITFGSGSGLFRVDGLNPSTVYYMRAYALTATNAVGYGEIIKVVTIPRGTVTYSMAGGFPETDYNRVNAAMKSAVEYYNTFTSIKGLNLSVNYGSGTPTAEASYGGWMRFGPSSSYQQTGTALHEMGHTVGVGTHWYWSNTTGSPLKVGGKWLGERANSVLNFMDGTTGAQMNGDATHAWPYFINGAQEDLKTDWLYTMNALLMQALGEDGLPTPTAKFATPAYTFEQTDGVKYYLKNEDVRAGRDTSFVMEENSRIVYRKMTSYEAAMNDSAAWYITFNPANCYYTIRNVATGKWFSYNATGENGIRLVAQSIPSTSNYFQLMGSRISVSVGMDGKVLSKKGYYVIYPTAVENPYCLVAGLKKTTSAASFDITDAATLQRWVILTAGELVQANRAVPNVSSFATEELQSVSIHAYGDNEILYLENLPEQSEVAIYNVLGEPYFSVRNVSDRCALPLPKGLYVVTVRAGKLQERMKIIIR